MGALGAIDLKCTLTYPNSANNKTAIVRFNTTSGATSGNQTGSAFVMTTTAASQIELVVRNTATNAQTVFLPMQTPFGTSATTNNLLALDTTVDTFLNINMTTASGAETIVGHCVALVMRAP